jgi:hypothetical protein
VQRFIKRIGIEETIGRERSAVVEDPVVSKHKQPGFEGSLFRIELLDGTKDIKEYLLHRVFSFGIIPQDAARNSE